MTNNDEYALMTTRGFRFEDGVAWIGDRSFPWASRVENSDLDRGLGMQWRQRHIHLTFENGWLLSITWGSGTYSANHSDNFGGEWHEESPTAELWGWSTIHGGRHVTEDPEGYLTADQVLAWIDTVSQWPTDYVPDQEERP